MRPPAFKKSGRNKPRAKHAWAAFICGLTALFGCLNTQRDSQSSVEYKVRGDFRKGPMTAGSEVSATMLDGRGHPTGKAYTALTENDSGDFHIALPGGVAEIEANGKYFDEIAGQLSATAIRLQGVVQVPQDGKTALHLNALTHLIGPRIKQLMAQGKKFGAASAQAQAELRQELGIIQPDSLAPMAAAALDLLGGNNPHTLYLFGVTSILEQTAWENAGNYAPRAAEALQTLIDSIASDFSEAGTINASLKKNLAAGEMKLDPLKTQKNLEQWLAAKHSTTPVPDLRNLVDSDKNGTPNLDDPDDDGDKVPDSLDCAPEDASRQMVSMDGLRCVAAYGPASLMAIPSSGAVKLLWDPLAGGPSYSIYYGEGNTLDTVTASKISGAAPGQLIGSLQNGHTYCFAIRSTYGGLVSDLSPTAKAVPMAIAGGFSAVAGTGQVTLKWSPADGAASYNLYFREGKGVDKNDKRVAGAVSPYPVFGLTDGKVYSFALASVSGNSESELGDTLYATPIAPPPKLRTETGDSSIILAWDTVAAASGYVIYYAKGDSAGVGSAKLNATAPRFIINGLENGTRYALRVQSLETSGASALSTTVWSVPMSNPSGVKAWAGTGKVRVDWNPISGATAYNVYYRTGTDPQARRAVVAPPLVLDHLINGKPVSICVAGTNSGIETGMSDTLESVPLSPPEGVQATMGDGKVELAWPPVLGASAYSVHYRQGNTADTSDSVVRSTNPSATIKGIANDIRYAFVLTSESQGGQSDPGATVSGMPMSPVTGFSVSSETDRITVKWDAVNGASGYNLYYRLGNTVDKHNTLIANVTAPYVISRLVNSQSYSFAIEVVKNPFTGPLCAWTTAVYRSSVLPVGKPGFSDSTATYLSLAMDKKGYPFLAFVDQGKPGNPQNLSRVMTFDGINWLLLGNPSTQPPFSCCNIAINPGNNMPFFAFSDGAAESKVSLKDFDGSKWIPVGSQTISTAKAEFTSFSMDALGTPMVAYNDSAFGGRATVKKLDNSQWSVIGAPGFTANPSGPLSLVISANGTVFLGIGGTGTADKSYPATVMTYNGNAWVTLGDAATALSGAGSGALSLAASPAGIVYAAFADRNYGLKATVMLSAGGKWSSLGGGGFTGAATQAMSLAVDANGQPYLAFADETQGGKLSILKYDGNYWLPACLPGFSSGRASQISMAIDPFGVPYVAFQDAGHGGKATVVKVNLLGK